MWLGVLGPLLVRDDDTSIRVPAGKQRVVLGALLARPNQVVSFDALADAAWAADRTDTARATIRNYVRRLRQVLGDNVGARIVTRDPGYLIEIDDDEYDLLAFTRLHRRGATAAAQGAWQEAADTLGTALSLWRGEPMVDIPSSVLRHREVPRLSELRLQALETLADAQLHLGRPDVVVTELAQLVREHPLRERPHALLMLALYRTGRQGDALAAYQAARGVLTDELGVEPGPELCELHTRILRNDPDLLPRKESHPAHASPQVAGLAVVVPHQLPAAVPRLAGRAGELKTLYDVLTEPAPATVVVIGGAAGVGKTTLALRWAHDVADRFADGQLYVDLRGFGPADRPVTPTEAIRGFLDAFGVPVDRIPKDLPGQTGLFRSLLAGKRVLIMLDNARDAAQVRPLLPGSPTCRVVVTSRSELTGVVATEGARALNLDVLSDLEAADLLVGRLDAERTASEPGVVAELTELCARLPLALSVVAARAAVRPQLPLAAFVTELRDVRGRLDALDIGDTGRAWRLLVVLRRPVGGGQADVPAARVAPRAGRLAGRRHQHGWSAAGTGPSVVDRADQRAPGRRARPAPLPPARPAAHLRRRAGCRGRVPTGFPSAARPLPGHRECRGHPVATGPRVGLPRRTGARRGTGADRRRARGPLLVPG
jgi:DNA-binding SARP family transcriptional activator